MNDTSKQSLEKDLDALEEFQAKLDELLGDIQSWFLPAVSRLKSSQAAGADWLKEHLDELVKVGGALSQAAGAVYLAGGDEGALLYWEFELKDRRSVEQATAAMMDAFNEPELSQKLALYHAHKRKLAEASRPEFEVVPPWLSTPMEEVLRLRPELDRLLRLIRTRYHPASERLADEGQRGADRLAQELRVTRLESNPGTLYSVSQALSACLES